MQSKTSLIGTAIVILNLLYFQFPRVKSIDRRWAPQALLGPQQSFSNTLRVGDTPALRVTVWSK